MTKTIKVNVKSVYGNTMVYPICDDAKRFASIANTQTLTSSTVALIKGLGYTIQVEPIIREL